MNQRGKNKNELKEMRRISETFRTILSATTFKSQESQKKKKTERKKGGERGRRLEGRKGWWDSSELLQVGKP